MLMVVFFCFLHWLSHTATRIQCTTRQHSALAHLYIQPWSSFTVTLAWEGKQSGHPAEQPARGGGEEACQAEDSFTVADSNRIQLN